MEPRSFLEKELSPIIKGIVKRKLSTSTFEQAIQSNDSEYHLQLSLDEGAFVYLKAYLDNYILPRLFEADVDFDKYTFGEVTNLKETMHLEMTISFKNRWSTI